MVADVRKNAVGNGWALLQEQQDHGGSLGLLCVARLIFSSFLTVTSARCTVQIKQTRGNEICTPAEHKLAASLKVATKLEL